MWSQHLQRVLRRSPRLSPVSQEAPIQLTTYSKLQPPLSRDQAFRDPCSRDAGPSSSDRTPPNQTQDSTTDRTSTLQPASSAQIQIHTRPTRLGQTVRAMLQVTLLAVKTVVTRLCNAQ